MKKYPWQKSECELIHNEIFQTTIEHKYYLLGVSQGLYFIYKILNEHKDKTFTGLEIMEIIKYASNDGSDIKEYFNRLLKDLDEN